MSNTFAKKVGIGEMFGGNKEICNFFVFVIHSLNQFGWYCEAYRTVCLPPSHLRRGTKGLELENLNRQGHICE